ncbi:hypothetical protein PHYPSEUDO_007439 [Phytophthora pseudosyringae]|uniref:1,3-beta-glucan synthase n=1 Tax=Phytophthora pseudosyringae TaxID=221518 RepID=A0A8T1WHJ7_9STRA|nr:hypothetical protein PHYPSEUDO_007439 [Phytophthora pseudosyringae]
MARHRTQLTPLLLLLAAAALLSATCEALMPITNALDRARHNFTAFQKRWIDPDTDPKFYNISVPKGAFDFGGNSSFNNEYKLIFSDEFNNSKRTFEAGFDPKWTAIDIRDTTNMGQHYFLPQAVQIDKGNLIITTSKPKKRYRGAKYVSGSVQTWNKFCYTGGYVEVQAVLPGKWGIPGTWPAIWIMGNIGRAPFLRSQDGTWPWSFDVCAPYVEKVEKVKQKINACGNLTNKHDKASYPEMYGMNPFQGRGATEIDVIEAQIRARDEPAFISTSLQIRPSLYDDMRPGSMTLPGPGQWYQGLKFGDFTRINSDYYGEMGLDSISALTQLQTDSFKAYHTYRLDWSPGPEGYIRWWMDNNFLFEIPGSALNKWVGTVPPRLIPVEPSYLILSTAVSEKFSPPCDGQICNSLWPSNFTINYVRVYQGNPNRYTSVGCNPEAYPTTEWIYAHPVEYGLPWYVSLRVDIGLLQLFAVINASVGLFMAFRGTSHPKMMSAYASSLWMTASFYGALSASAPDDFVWIQTALACLGGLVLGGLCCLVYPVSLGAMLGLYGGVMISQFVPLLSARVITAVLVGVGIALGCAPQIDTKHVVILSTSWLGSLAFVLSVSLWVSEGDIAENAWGLAGFIFNGDNSDHVGFCSEHCLAMYVLLVVLSAVSTTYEYLRLRGVTLRNHTISARKAKFPPVSASSDARSWRPDDEVSGMEKNMVNFFSPVKLPHNMQQFSTIFRIAVNVQRSFGFQLDNFRNQTEHIVVLLTNNTRKGGNPYRKLHDLVFSNYSKWCSKLEIQPLHWSEQRAPQGGLTSVDEISVDLCLFFFIWGEASNLRHSPEFLCFLFHKMKEEFPSVRHSEREAGYFLDTVVTPVYGLLKAEMTSKHDHEDRHNYDDFNEFFWTKACLKYDYKHEEVIDVTSPNPSMIYQQKKQQRQGLGGLGGLSGRGGLNGGAKNSNFFDKRKSIAEGFTESAKTFVEKRTWLLPLRAFNRIFNFHVISFQFLAMLAFTNEQEMNFQDSCRIISSTLITPFLLDILGDGLDIFAVYHVHQKAFSTARNVVRVLLHLVIVVVSTMLYWYAWAYGGVWWQSYYIAVVLFHVPGLINCVMQVMPGLTNWTRRTKFVPIAFIRDIVSPMNRLYVGDNVLDPESMSVGYQFFWTSQLAWKLYFSYKFEISPLVIPSFLLYADHVENNVSVITTVCLILVNWIPFFLVFCVDITIWNSIWMAFTGTFVGFSSHIGEIRNFSRVRSSFSRAVDAFNAKVIARNSKTGLQILESTGMSYGSTALGHEVLDRVAGGADPTARILSQRRTSVHDDETPLLSFSRRKQTPMERQAARRRKWFSFSVAWDTIIDSMRADDLISNKEKALLHFHRLDGYQREIYLPQFQLAGCFENFTSNILDIYSSNDGKVSERVLQDKLLEILSESPMVEESLEEIWELANWVLVNVLGPCHANDVKYITSVLNSWAARGVFRALNLQKVAPCGRALAGLVSLLKSNARGWKNNAKVIPVRKDPSDYTSFEFPQQSSSYRPAPSGLTKSASTTGLSSLGLEPPRRSRGSGVARIARMQQQTHKPALNNGKATHSIPSAHIMQIRERVRTFLNLGKEILAHVHEQDPVYTESKGISDRLTWILTQERGFMWDDNYTGEQITLTAFESHTDVVLSHLHGLLTLQKIDAEPQSYDARRRLLFFVNSLFMDMPLAPLLEEMKSWSVMTPFYAEDVLYSRKDLESKQDGLDVHTLLFLQTLYKRDWENFLERVKPKKNIWKDPETAIELRMWASLRGQTLSRTVQGMMYGEAAIRLLAEIEQVPQQKLEELINTKFTQRLDFFKLLSFYYNHVGFYMSTCIIIWTVYILLYCNLLRALLSLEGVGGREPVLLSKLQLMLGSVAFFTTAPLLATISVERGFKAALSEILVLFVTGGPLYFLFHIGTKWFYFGQTILAGGAKYRATGRGFVTKHSSFDELYRFYASSHLYAAVEIAIGLISYYKFTVGYQYFFMTWSLWLVFISWYWSPFWFNPLSFEWSDVMEDFRLWFKWMRGDGGNPDQSWEAWFKEENAYFSTLRPWSKACVSLKGGLFALIAISISSTSDDYHSILTESTWLPLVICCSMAAVYLSAEAVFFSSSRSYGENGLVRFLKLLLVLVLGAGLILAFVFVDGMWQCLLSMGYLAAAVGCWALVLLGSNSRFVGTLYFVHDAVLGLVSLSLILLLAALYVPGKIQTWLLYNNALSRGVVIEDILRANSSNDDRDDDLSVQQMRSIIVEQQRFINVLTASGSDTDMRATKPGKKEDLMHAMSDNTLNAVLRNMSESELSALQDSSSRLQAIMSEEERKVVQRKQQQEEQKLAEAGMNPSLSRTRRAFSTNDFSAISSNASPFNLPTQNTPAAPSNGTAANGPHAPV